jgi:DNA-directed RNA polymerase specialized sigma24 family protein
MAPSDRQRWNADVARTVSTLAQPQAAALRLVYADGLGEMQAAEAMGLTRNEFSSVVAQGMRRLGQLLMSHSLATEILHCQPDRRTASAS